MARRNNNLSPNEIFEMHTNYIQSDAIDFQIALEKFLEDCEIRNCRPQTIQYYRNEMSVFYKLLREQGIEVNIYRMTPEIIKQNVILYMKNQKNCKTVTINTRLRALRAFFNFLEREKIISKKQNPFHEIKLLKDRKKAVPTFTKEEIHILFKQPNLRTFTGVRDLTIMMLLLETGIRASECVGIRLGDIDFQRSRILIQNTKGYRQRYVPIQKQMKEQLKKYLAIRGTLDHDYLFVSIDDTPLTKRQMQAQIESYGKKCGIHATCHKFRHTFARLSVEAGAGIFELQAVLGHSSMEMVKHYVNLFSDDVIEKHKSFSPIENVFSSRRRR
ncbi:recombinase XerD [Geobacillus thermodenitrificans]|uniref:tyrosine-type recombinase/integrase n=1 Tax=Geobacillus thermodenitrificans TaxID=33940 RepID=UPI000C05C34C|nr:tyrosine-type recombinase/integrase [Geobacillus thermodenitrificans]ATO38038.1 recombinase XerD [Geobacillus thermodenitrificans]